jgi:hypothetical protein
VLSDEIAVGISFVDGSFLIRTASRLLNTLNILHKCRAGLPINLSDREVDPSDPNSLFF